ncbi:MAG: tetratricopeptide repeat protein, partial [Candidatus Binatia bacterium]
SLQYIGDKVVNSKAEVINIDDLRSLNPRLLYPLLDNATDLDPKFVNAYSFGAILLPAIDARQAIALTEKGIANNPDQWRLYQYLGYIYWRMKDYDKAAEIYKKGAAIPGAGSFMEIMAARMKTEGGSRDTAREMYFQMLAEATDDQTKVTAQNRLMQLDSLDERDAIDLAMKSYREKHGSCLSSWRDLIPLLNDVKLPHGKDFRIDSSGSIVDPSGAPYLLDEKACTAKLDPEKTKIATDE